MQWLLRPLHFIFDSFRAASQDSGESVCTATEKNIFSLNVHSAVLCLFHSVFTYRTTGAVSIHAITGDWG